MHACVICHESSLTGAPRIGFDIASYLADSHQVTLLSKKDGPLIDLPVYKNLKSSYRSLNTSHELCDLTYSARVGHAVEVLREITPDVLYVNSIASGEWCEAGDRVGVPVALHTHETRYSLPSLLSSVCTPRILCFVDLLVGASQQAIDDIETITGASVSNHIDLGIFIDLETVLAKSEELVPPAVNLHGSELSGKKPTIAMCGLAQPRKGADIFLDTALRLSQYDFLWIGPWLPSEAPLNDANYKRFESLAPANLYWTGLTENPYAYMLHSDAFLLTARRDPNPLVVAEALVLGKKVFAFAETGNSKEFLDRLGYVINGSPECGRIVGILPRILENADGAWLNDLRKSARKEFDGVRKLSKLAEVLCQLATRQSGF